MGVDGSAFIAERAEGVIAENGLAETVGVVRGRIEELSDAAVLGVADGAEVREEDKFDVIVSEWMGYGLLFECMLDSVIVARDRWLKRGGAVLPDVARILVAGGSALAADLPFWDEVHGLSMGTIRQELRKAALKEALVRPVDAQAIVTAPQLVRSLDLSTMSVADTTSPRLSAERVDGWRRGTRRRGCCVGRRAVVRHRLFGALLRHKTLVLSTSPLGPRRTGCKPCWCSTRTCTSPCPGARSRRRGPRTTSAAKSPSARGRARAAGQWTSCSSGGPRAALAARARSTRSGCTRSKTSP